VKAGTHATGGKFSNLHDRANRVGTPVSQGKTLNKSLQKVLDSKQKTSKNKSFRTDKVNEKMHNYMKNNFFLKSSYNNPLSGYIHENSKSKTTKNIKNYTNIDIREQHHHNERDQMNSLNMDDAHRGILNEKLASGIKFGVLLQIEELLNKIVVTTQKGFEIYDYIKEYVDIVQEENFEIYYVSLILAKLYRNR
jgi:hypothetical protein